MIFITSISFHANAVSEIKKDTYKKSLPTVIRIDTTRKKHLNKKLWGVNENYLFHAYSYINEDTYYKYGRPLKFNVLRFPGGSSANAYYWKDGSYAKYFYNKKLSSVPHLFHKEKHDGIKHNKNILTVAEFIHIFKQFRGVTPVYVAQMFRPAEEFLELYDLLKSKGLNIKYVELGNELYYDPYASRTGPVDEFIPRVEKWCKLIRKHAPDLVISLPVGGNHLGHANILGGYSEQKGDLPGYSAKTVPPRQTEWNKKFSEVKGFNAVSVHHYLGYFLTKKQKSEIVSIFKNDRKSPRPYDYLFAAAEYEPAILTKYFTEYYPAKKFLLTEYNVYMKIREWRSTWGAAIANMSFILKFFEMGDLWELANYHAMTGRAMNLYNYHYQVKGGKAEWNLKRMIRKMGYYPFEMLGGILENADQMYETNVINSPLKKSMAGYADLYYPLISAHTFYGRKNNKDIIYTMIINKGAEEQTIQLDLKKGKFSSAVLTGYSGNITDSAVPYAYKNKPPLKKIEKKVNGKSFSVPGYFIGYNTIR